jgi:hypothetical protein
LNQALLHLQREVAAEQVERAVRHVDDAHQTEDQREAAGDDEEQGGERHAVERHDGELAQILARLDGEPDEERGREKRDNRALGRECAAACSRCVAGRPLLTGRRLGIGRSSPRVRVPCDMA